MSKGADTQGTRCGDRNTAVASIESARRVFVIFLVVAALAVVAGLTLPTRPLGILNVEAGERVANLLEMFLVTLFFGATLMCIGVAWAARILAARRYTRSNPYPSARTVAVAQYACFAIYALYVAAAVYYRLRLGGGAFEFTAAVAAAAGGAYYFLRLPTFLHRRLFGGGEE